jgi:ketosteroid isomerase-like protein
MGIQSMTTRGTSAAAVAVLTAMSAAAAAAQPAPAAPPAKPAATAAAAPAAKTAGPSDRAQITALEQAFNEAFTAKNVDLIMSNYARDGLFVFDVTPPRQHVGWADYRKDWQDLFAANPGPAKSEIKDLSITVVGPVAYSHFVQDGWFTSKSGAKTELVVRVTDVYRKAGGKWKIVQEHVSVPVDLATMKPDPLSKL